MKPAVRRDIYPAAVPDGAYLLTPDGPIELTGPSIGAWLERLVPHLDGQRTLAELTGGLDPERQELVVKIVAALRERGLVWDAAADEPPSLPAATMAEYQPELAYLESYPGSAAARFASWRGRRTLVVTRGALGPELVAAAFGAGLRRVGATGVDIGPTGYRDPEQRLEPLPPLGPLPPVEPGDDPPAGAGSPGGWLADAGLALHAFDDPADQWCGWLERACAAAGVPLAQVLLAGDEAWLVPTGTTAGGTGWSAIRRRVRPASAPPTPAGPSPVEVGAAAATLLASRLVQAAFRSLTEVADHPDPADHTLPVTRVRLDSWRAESHRCLPHPYSLPGSPATEADLCTLIDRLAAAPRLAESEFSQRAAAALDQRLGIFSFPDYDWAQLPLPVTAAEVADPVGLLDHAPPPAVLGTAFTYQTARCLAAREALARYSSLMVDPRRLVDPVTHDPLSGDPDQLLAGLRQRSICGAGWGYEVARPDRRRLLAAAAIFPALHRPAVTPVGLGAGYDWPEAVTAGLLDHFRQRAIMALTRPARPYPELDLATAGLTGPGAGAHDLLVELGGLPRVYDLTGWTGVPAYAFCQGPDTLAVTTGTTAAGALADGLLVALRAVQARVHQQPGYAPAPLPRLPDRLRGAVGPPPSQSFPADPAALAARLTGAGPGPVAVPLDHDPAVAALLPFLVRVVVPDA